MTHSTSRTSCEPAAGIRRRRQIGLVLVSVLILSGVLAVRHYWSAEPASAQMPQRAPNQAARPAVRPQPSRPETTTSQPPSRGAAPTMDIVARVNGETLSREDLARECLRHYGRDVLESVISKQLIAMECASRGIQVTQADVNAEVDRMAKHFNFSVQQWYEMIEKERGIRPSQYTNDIVWPTLALRRLAADQLTVSDEELRREYETQYGPSVRARLIACDTPEDAERLRATALANPDDFGRLAKDHSKDPTSAAELGFIPPICMHGGPKEIEEAAFAMKDGEISPVIEIHGQYVILKRESGVAGREVPIDKVAAKLRHLIEERKIRRVADEVFSQLQKKAKVENYLNDPDKRATGIVAVLNGRQITARQLAEVCIERHGKEALEGMINRRMIEQACKKAKIEVTEEDMHEEIARAASVSVKPKADGTPDVEAWIELVTQQQNISYEVYKHDSVWPSVALRKLVDGRTDVTEEDIEKGFEANYGPRVRCLAIVFADLRQTKRVWELARNEYNRLADARKKQIESGMTPREQADQMFFDSFGDFFGNLAEQYSRDPGSKNLRGQVPPIRKFGGQPVLEREAFALQPGELSGIIQVDDMYVVLFCQGHTTPENVDLATVRDLIVEDLREKKLHQAMADYFQRLQDFSTVDNYLAGTTQSPQRDMDNSRPLAPMRQTSARR
ncbi:MAG: peptidylprolyl isomerase [Pirellulaceae bacterium]|nr:peptidylprolyl isomerase [Pirellulaceae bacterium]